MTKFNLIEPQRGLSFLMTLIETPEKYPRINTFAPIGADIFVFIYPILLIVLYLKGIIQKKREKKEGALFIFFSCCISIIINIFIQFFFLKNRPNVELFHLEAEETLLHKFLPSSAFPSDHATVSMSIAIATLLRGYQTKNKKLIRIGYFLIMVAIIMSTCRMITIVHRPTDIIGGFAIGILIPILLSRKKIFKKIQQRIISPIIKLQEKILPFG